MLALVTLLLQVSLVANSDILPKTFAKWQASGVEKFSQAELTAFAGADAEILREYGFLAAERKQYAHGASHVTVEAIRMTDASAAYGLFTFYRRAEWRDDPAPKFQAAIGPDQSVLLRNSYVLRILHGELPQSQLASLAQALPTFKSEPLPTLPDFLPQQDLVPRSTKYFVGPRISSLLAPQVPPQALGFEVGAEAEIGKYQIPGKPPMTLMLVMLPTPQLALQKARLLNLQTNAGFTVRRKGSLLSVVVDAPKEDAAVLLDRVKYSIEVMWNQDTSRGKREPNVGTLILNIVKLSGALILFALVSGLLHALVRMLSRRFFPDRFFDTDMEVIRLNLSN